ncbi:hypothetical protein OO013_13805 [Mangrovivirga sp. M17]|uniref:Uncharacterized protein n=1 Tax=Mangrovivirga halotolerans TaxID=2993936 RepID=A0ABT3RUM5_9BACT|nr:hypothetical protein [Mangrovivirga halotolerans]MCX2744952.1 hypothetical protein [Mangrovivirga halotolerans]
MKNLHLSTFICLIVSILQINAQSQTAGGVSTKGVDMNTNAFGAISQFDSYVPSEKGTVYLTDGWHKSSFTLADDRKIEDVWARLDLVRKQFEIKNPENINDIKVLSISMIKSFSYLDVDNNKTRFFKNAKYMGQITNLQPGLYEILSQGENIKLVKKAEIKVIEGNYNVALDVGSKDKTFKRDFNYYWLIDNELMEVKKSTIKKSDEISSEEYKSLKKFNKNNESELIETTLNFDKAL